MLTAEDEKMIDSFKEGRFKKHFIDFIEYRRGKGEKVQVGLIGYMKTINDILAPYDTDVITKGMADEVFSKNMDDDGLVHHNLLSTMRAFTIYMAVMVPGTFVVPVRYWNTRRIGKRCYTFTREEVYRIISTVDSYCSQSSNLQKKYKGAPPHPIVVRLLAGTGMRIGEVLSLKSDDVDLENGIISIHDGKGHVSRLIPLSASLSEVLRYYYGKRKNEIDVGRYYFPSQKTHNPFSHTTMGHFLSDRFDEAGLLAKNGEKPVVHTFRHTFCTMALDRLIDEGVHPDAAVPLLAAYVGHNDLRVTYRYLHMTESRIESIYQSESFAKGLIPEDKEDTYEW